MQYASTKATFKKEFGGGQLKEEYYANMKEEVTLSGYKRHLKAEQAPGPLSREEEEMLEIKQTENLKKLAQTSQPEKIMENIKSEINNYLHQQIGLGKRMPVPESLEFKTASQY